MALGESRALKGAGDRVIKKWFEIILDHRISMRERMFRIVTVVCMIALVFTLPMGRRLLNIAILVVSLLAMAAIVKISIRKGRVEAGATAIVVLMLALWWRLSLPVQGVALALCAGALASALGYILWYALVPCYSIAAAAAAQLSVPVITALGAVVFVGEAITLRLVLCSAAILGGIFIVALWGQRHAVPRPDGNTTGGRASASGFRGKTWPGTGSGWKTSCACCPGPSRAFPAA